MVGGGRRRMRDAFAKMQDRVLFTIESAVEKAFGLMGPIYVLTATTLIFTVAYVFFFIVLTEIGSHSAHNHRDLHGTVGIILLFNVLFNYFACVFTKPGTTIDVDQTVLHSSMREQWKFCKKCNRPKPDLAHHCRICRRCVLRMDHHCPWVANCIGFRNYRYFFLFLFYLSVSCGYAFFLMASNFSDTHIGPVRHAFLQTFAMVLSGAACLAVSVLLVWHIFLVLTGQGTIDFYDNFRQWQIARKEGRRWRNPYNLGGVKNFKEVFDVDGRFWWIVWLLPTVRVKKGTGVLFPINSSWELATGSRRPLAV